MFPIGPLPPKVCGQPKGDSVSIQFMWDLDGIEHVVVSRKDFDGKKENKRKGGIEKQIASGRSPSHQLMASHSASIMAYASPTPQWEEVVPHGYSQHAAVQRVAMFSECQCVRGKPWSPKLSSLMPAVVTFLSTIKKITVFFPDIFSCLMEDETELLVSPSAVNADGIYDF
ncbi:hypothetical protein WISP_107041 [Willisornis vidua]|uniref:Uncharacterized protein n=1 Tax=Willisornis vidua TaxID=1566151 RepID=A0ABQ9D2L4_9PASS|nr:hypothetical protein WISP_107041 [Willisornis vidua]